MQALKKEKKKRNAKIKGKRDVIFRSKMCMASFWLFPSQMVIQRNKTADDILFPFKEKEARISYVKLSRRRADYGQIQYS